MTEVITTLATAAIIASGTATRYAPGKMAPVVANRTEWGHIDPAIPHKGYIALLECDHIGRLVWLQHYGKVGGPYMVADCAAGQDRDRLKQLGWAVDLSYEVALDWGVIDDVGRGFVVWDADPRQPPGEVE